MFLRCILLYCWSITEYGIVVSFRNLQIGCWFVFISDLFFVVFTKIEKNL